MLNYKLKTLANGLRLVSAPLDSTEAITILILVGTGGRFETKEQSGISHFLEHLFFKGSKKYPSTFEIASVLESIGADYNAFTGEEETGFYVQSSASDFPKAFDVISDMFLNPVFDPKELEKERGVILQEASMYRDTPQAHVQNLNQQQLFLDQPLGMDLIGTTENIKSINIEQIKKYRETQYSGKNTIVVVCGKDADKYEKMVEQRFSNVRSGQKNTFKPYTDTIKPKSYNWEKREVDQTHFVLSFLSCAKSDPKKFPLAILNTLLGSGMSSRLSIEIREKRGLAYYIYSNLSQYFDVGSFVISGGVKPDMLDKSLEIINIEIDDLKKNGPSASELERAKGNLRGQLALSLEQSFKIASYIADNLYYYQEIKDIRDTIEKINRVTAEEVKSLAQEIFDPSKKALSVIGQGNAKVKTKDV
jgi:predicted Zn-dependent peptidase